MRYVIANIATEAGNDGGKTKRRRRRRKRMRTMWTTRTRSKCKGKRRQPPTFATMLLTIITILAPMPTAATVMINTYMASFTVAATMLHMTHAEFRDSVFMRQQ